MYMQALLFKEDIKVAIFNLNELMQKFFCHCLQPLYPNEPQIIYFLKYLNSLDFELEHFTNGCSNSV